MKNIWIEMIESYKHFTCMRRAGPVPLSLTRNMNGRSSDAVEDIISTILWNRAIPTGKIIMNTKCF